MSFFRRAQSKVFYGNSTESPYQSIYSSIDREIAKTRHSTLGTFHEEAETSANNESYNSRQGSPSSHKSQVRNFFVLNSELNN